MNQHSIRAIVLIVALTGLCAMSAVSARAQAPADNTKVNTRDRDKATVTADQQKESSADRDLTKKIRRALTQNKTLSSYARNVKIITQDGQVTLKGPVRSEDEKQTVEHTATDVAGTGHVTNELSIAPKKP